MKQSIILHTLDTLYEGVIIKRPSASIKSPYVADVDLEGVSILGHTAALGCCGLADVGATVFMTKNPVNDKGECKTKCQYRIVLSKIIEKGVSVTIGIAPKLAENIAYNAIKNHCIQGLCAKTITREKTIMNSRFDFMGKTIDDRYYILEVKNVPLADYVDCASKERKKMNFDDREWNDKIAYFPDGYRKQKDATVSERAVKHITELMKIKQQQPDIQTILLFVIQRNDVSSFQPSRLDKIYLQAIREAFEAGVEIKTLVVEWRDQSCYFIKNDLPINMYD